jgi:hypothetical protein
MDKRNEFWTKGSIEINPKNTNEKPQKLFIISDNGYRDLGQIIKNDENIIEFLDYLNNHKSKYNFLPGTFCK